MTHVRDPLLTTVAIDELRPTQITVGMIEVKAKRKRWREIHGKDTGKFLGKHMIPVILGPKKYHYVVDHHHLARALHDEGVKNIAVTVLANLSKLDADAFWIVMDNRNWMHPFDADGRRRHYEDIPKSITRLVDDPFRSLAGELRRAGGFAKDTTPFSEFLWADFLRRRIKRKLVDHDFAHAMEKAMQLAKSPDANYLPGWCGASPDE
ncbi:MAG TPA: ParB-like protein [Xanthobacteraceae bacterium]|nr:ParB-like protein [Xanthobacteraceae bacterium]